MCFAKVMGQVWPQCFHDTGAKSSPAVTYDRLVLAVSRGVHGTGQSILTLCSLRLQSKDIRLGMTSEEPMIRGIPFLTQDVGT
jgi:hypothetical protein